MRPVVEWLSVGRRRYWVPLVAVVIAGAAFSGGDPDPALFVASPSTTTSLGTSTTSTSTTTSSTSTTTTSTAPTTTSSSPPETTTTDSPTAVPPGAQAATVLAITDGDTIRVSVGGSADPLRIIGINSPESGECFAREATEALAALLPVGTEVHLIKDRSDRDQYGRLLRYVLAGDLDVGEEMVRSGAAIAREYPPDTARADRLAAAQEKAREAGRGLWAADACGAASGSEVEVDELHADAPGNDHENLNGEFVVILNRGGIAVDFTGWVLKDESATHRFSFPAGFVLGPGARVTVFTGCGTDGADRLHWCSQRGAVWNNDGDTAFLLDHHGNVVHSLSSR